MSQAKTTSVSIHGRIVFVGHGRLGSRMTKLVERLRLNHLPVPMKALAEELECDTSTVKRIVHRLVHEFELPIVSSRAGYAWRPPTTVAQAEQQKRDRREP